MPPKQEVRAVWITTVLGLDWPRSKDTVQQKKSLLEIINRCSSAHINTLFFQVRGRGDAMYRSRYEPWSHLLTGEPGKDPGWDPLQFVLTEAHKRGMEVHAWFNTFLIKSGKDKPAETKPRHLILEHPEWVKLTKGEWWLDAGIPQAREYLLTVAMDIVRNYDIDGIHFDFMRYSPNGFPDDDTWKKFGNNLPKGEWRRENINMFVRAFYDSANAAKPTIKIGATPIGIYNAVVYRNGMKGVEDVYQDAKQWLREGKMDYIAPQVYWSLKDTAPGPDFAPVTKDWVDGSNQRHVYVGIAAYKPDVYKQMLQLLDTSRALGTQGHVFFRYDNIRRIMDSIPVYPTLANIPPMKWKDSVPPAPPFAFRVQRDSNRMVTLHWNSLPEQPTGNLPVSFNVYRSPRYPVDIDNPLYLYKILLSPQTIFTDSLGDGSDSYYHYAVTSLDKGNNESLPAQEGIAQVPEVLAIINQAQSGWKLHDVLIQESEELAFVPFELKEKANVTITVWDGVHALPIVSMNERRVAGKNIAAFSLSEMDDGRYVVKLESEKFTAQREFVVGE